MNKKYFIFITVTIALFIFSLLAVANYRSDLTRALHHDYNYVYKEFHPNKLFLKTVYLLDNKDKYDTFVYGSSRGGFMDVSLISDKAYNMSHGFGTIATYLDNLKTLLANDIKPKHVWLGLNDFDIWKDQNDGLVNMGYHNGIFGNVLLFSDWLFKLRPNNIKILLEDIPLVKSPYITNTKDKVDHSREAEKKLEASRNIPPATLGYTGIFRIDEAIDELKEIKKICDENNITLTVFFYPIFYKTYLEYDQDKIEEFKRKLVTVIDFYDFYDLGEIALNQKNWFEGSHFVPSVGDHIINNIKENKSLVTKENIDARIQQTQYYEKHMPLLPSMGVCKVNHLKIDTFDTIFDIKDSNYTYFKNDDFELKRENAEFIASVTRKDPYFILDNTKTTKEHTILSLILESQKRTICQLYFRNEKNPSYSEKHKYNLLVKEGINRFKVLIPGDLINGGLRVDFARDLGEYKIKEFTIKEAE